MIGGQVIVCDDIRQEAGNKLSFMGVFTGSLEIGQNFPTTLPKLGVFFMWQQTLDEENLPVDLVGQFPWDPDGSPTIRLQLDPNMAPRRPALDGAPDAERLAAMYAAAVLSPVTLLRAGIATFYAIRKGVKIPMRRMEIKSVAMDTASPAVSSGT